MTDATPDITHHRQGRAGFIVLNRPQALNALTLPMIRGLQAALDAHVADPAVQVIVVHASAPRAFCAGGDMRRIRELSLEGRIDEAMTFFREEYALNLAIATCPKPYVAWMDGIVMGGGLGLSVHGRHRLVTERSVLAMPETAIGFFPDVGGSYFLPRLPMNAGRWVGLTGTRLNGDEATVLGLGSQRLDSADQAALFAALADDDAPVPAVIDRFARPVDDAGIRARFARRGQWFDGADIAAIDANLAAAAETDADAATLLATLRSMSPYAMRTSLALLERGRGHTLPQALDDELVLTEAVIQHPDFIEGVRAVLVDKDRQPRWQPA
ncbi:enoyl-CoA hydratase/isomerase family protein [Rubrivivax albus]|nr:enoyl-CoA hydratase/isomerase family protein [Rubrivivax albus]